ncbi:hypothetical protein CAPTEDRAFT_189611, partial [Capitella teleta]
MDQRHREVTLAMDMPVLNPTAITNHTMQTAKSHYFTENSIPSAVNTLTAFIIFAREFESKCIEQVAESNVAEVKAEVQEGNARAGEGNAGVEDSSGSESIGLSDKELQQQFDNAIRSAYPVTLEGTRPSLQMVRNFGGVETSLNFKKNVLSRWTEKQNTLRAQHIRDRFPTLKRKAPEEISRTIKRHHPNWCNA